MKTLFNPPEYFNEDYYERGAETGKSLYSHYRWMPELTIPMAHHLARYMDLDDNEKVLDFGCAKGFTVRALRLLGYKAFGVDVSQYAFDEMDAKTGKWCGVIKPQEKLVCAKGGYDWILCKDILEHIPYDKIDEQLKVLHDGGKKVMAMIPLGDGKKYIIDSYELDKSHFIREDIHWWCKKFEEAEFDIDMATYDMGPFKKNWQFEPKGNCLILASRR
jgi:2-polyprenyl-3-methyl-5-hydroxy-6-metoxy-1,4-benzoquinol methylase